MKEKKKRKNKKYPNDEAKVRKYTQHAVGLRIRKIILRVS